MTDIVGSLSTILVEETDFNSAVSEALMQKLGANINALQANVQFHSNAILTGSGNWVAPDGVTKILVVAVAGGGGGGGGGEGLGSGAAGDAIVGFTGITGGSSTFNSTVVALGGFGGRGGIGGFTQGGVLRTGHAAKRGSTLIGTAYGNGGAGGSGDTDATADGGGGESGEPGTVGFRVFTVVPAVSYPYSAGTGGAGGAGGDGGTTGGAGSPGSTGSNGAILIIY